MTSRDLRQAFLDFFERKVHQIVPSAPVVLRNEPTLMFTNAGMNQFKELFLGEAVSKYPRVADTQRCLRVSVKHNDLEEVGFDTYHHAIFELLGNWSFGDYFKKKEAIEWAWELLDEVLKLDKVRLYVTVFEGDVLEGLQQDEEVFNLWKALIPEDRILLGNKKDNFWEMEGTGHCAPCFEIHYDIRSDEERTNVKGQDLVNMDDPQVIEIWSLVFIQFNRLKDGSLESLSAKSVDTGMSFERLVRAIQGMSSNYYTDVFPPLIQFIAQKSGIAYESDEKSDIAMRFLSDHILVVSFAIADDQLPSNNKAGYVIRRILRRAVRYAYTFLHFKTPFIYELVPVLAEQFKGVVDELYQQKYFVEKVILEEYVAFLRTLTQGIQRFESCTSDTNVIEEDFAFELFDTFGLPIDLTELLAREKGITVHMNGFHQALLVQKERSRTASAIYTGDWVLVNEDKESEFVGYDTLKSNTEILKYRKVSTKGKDQYQLVLSKTPFYAEGGGQVRDKGFIRSLDTNERISIVDTKIENELFIHYVNQLPNVLVGEFETVVDDKKTTDTEANHSATHLLQEALKKVLGDHVYQKGSLVSPNVHRFDFWYFAKLTYEEIKEIKDIVKVKIRQDIPLKEERNVPFQKAFESGVTALFGEKYGDHVRVITFDDFYSKELWGGTHVNATGQIGLFKILSESAVSAGVSRIEAITGTKSEKVIREHFELFGNINELLNNPKDFVSAVY